MPVLCVPRRSAWPLGAAPRCAFVATSTAMRVSPRRRGMSGGAATRARSRRFNVGQQCFIALSCRRFARARLPSGQRPYWTSRCRAPTALVATWEKTKKEHELAYSATSSSTETSFWPGAPHQSKRGSQKSCEPSYRQPSKGSERTRRPQRPPCARTPQRARGSLSSARDRGAPRRRRGQLKHNHKTPRGHHKPR